MFTDDIASELSSIVHRKAFDVVVKVNKHILAIGKLFLDPPGLRPQLLRRITAGVVMAVEAQLGPVACQQARVVIDHVVDT